MERIRPLEPPYREDIAEELRKIMPPGIEPIRLFRILAHNPRVLSRVRKGGLLDPGSISMREREVVILRTTELARAEYEWGVHKAFFGVELEPGDALLVEMCDALHRDATIGDELWSRLALAYEPAQLIELIALAGQYRAISYLVNALRIELEPGAPMLPSVHVGRPSE